MILDGVSEVVGAEHLESCLASGRGLGGGPIKAYIGFEPSGHAHLGWLVLSQRMRRFLDADLHLTVLLADWHGWINDKLGGSLESIEVASVHMESVFRCLLDDPPEGDGPGEVSFVRASQLVDDGDYWAGVIRHMKNVSLARIRKTFSIMGRDESDADGDTSKFLYPAMQSQDIHTMDIDVALGGMDQRKAHMYMRDVADRLGLPKATCVHTPIIPGLRSATGRMDASVIGGSGVQVAGADEKMSKSDPKGAILLHHGAGRIRKLMRGAHLDPASPDSPVHDILEHIVFVRATSMPVGRSEEHGGPLTIESVDQARRLLADGDLHPLDYKEAVAARIADLLAPLRARIESDPVSFQALDRLVQTHSN